MEKGEVFAEVSVLEGSSYPVYAEAEEESLLVFIERRALVDLIRKEPDVAVSLIYSMAKRLKYLANLVEMLSLKEVPSRLAQYLLEASQGREIFLLPVSKSQLALLLGTAPETLSRAFKKLSRAGAIDVRGSMVRVLSFDKLKEIAEFGMD